MQYPKLRVIPTSRQMIDVFGGYNHNLRINENEFFDMKNMTSDHYPVMSPRGGRGQYLEARSKVNGLIAKDALCYIDGTEFVMNEYHIEMGLNDEPKQLISMGAYVIILPDKKYINTKNIEDRGDIEVKNSLNEGDTVSVALVRENGEEYGEYPISDTAPEDPEHGDLWLDTSTNPHSLKQYSSTSSLMWVQVATTYVRISAPNIGKGINAYDGITIKGIKEESLNGSFIVQSAADDYVTVIAIIDEAFSQTEAITVSRKMPDMDFVTECGNRLWGCKYGIADGQVVNELYACKLGDFKNWECYMGISTDSWRASVGTDGMFTGATTHMGYPVFFKENCLHKVYVSSVGAHQVQDTACRGVQQGCERSLAIVNETLYYKARSGIMAYDGSLAVSASYVLGGKWYKDAVAAAHGNKYYVSMIDTETDEPNLFVYDTSKGLWHKEDDVRILDLCSCKGELYAIRDDRSKILTMTNGDEVVEWSVQTGEIGLNSPDMKFMSRLTVRMFLPPESSIKIFVQYGFEDGWDQVFETTSTRLRSFSVPIRPKRCDFMRMRIEGKGDAKIYAYTKTMRNGSEIS